MEARLVPKRTSTFHDWPYSGPQRKCFHAWIVNLTPPGRDHCIHNCTYCYARHAIYSRAPRGVMQIYSNLPELIERDLARIRLCPPLSISNTTDPCQAVPELRRETRRLVELLLRRGPSFSITTKGDPSFLLEVEGFAAFPRKFVAVTVEGPSDVVSTLSPGAPPYDARLEALRRLSSEGVACVARLDPMLIHVWRALYGGEWVAKLRAVLRDFKSSGASHVVSSTGRLSKSGPAPSMFDRLRELVAGVSTAEAAAMERDYAFSREGGSTGYFLKKPLRLGFHRLARAEAEGLGLTYASCLEARAEETDSHGLPHCEGVAIPFSLKGPDGVFRGVPGCTANCGVQCRLATPGCGRRALASQRPLRLAELR